MSDPAEKFKINLNQNLWGLLVTYVSLGTSEYYKLCVLFWFSVVVATVMTLSIAVTTCAYTINYYREKMKR